MKVVLYMAITANGYIARENGDTPWSGEEFKAYYDFVKVKGNVVVGLRTYELMNESDEFEKAGNPLVIVVSDKNNGVRDGKDSKAIFVSSLQEAVEVLKKKDFEEIVVGGGGTLNAGFLKEGLIDEIILDIEPLIFGKGIKLFKDTDAEAKLELVETSKLSANTIHLRYKVKK